MIEKITTTVSLERQLRKKLKRLASILEQTESSIMEAALRYYFDKSTLCRESWKLITDRDRFFEGLKKKRIMKEDGAILFRPYLPEEEVE